jgi:hypothetical protein
MLSSLLTSLRIRTATIQRLFVFLWRMRLWWLMPVVVVLLAISLVAVLAVSTPLGPFIYAVF